MNTSPSASPSAGLDLGSFASAIRNRWWLVLACVVLFAAAGALYAFAQGKSYSATSSVLFRESVSDPSQTARNVDEERQAATNVELVSLGVVADEVGKNLRPPLSGNTVEEAVAIETAGQADVVSINASDSDPKRAQEIANTYAETYVDFRRKADQERFAQAIAVVQASLDALPEEQADGPSGRTIRERLDQLETLRAFQSGNAEVVETADKPTSPSSLSIAGGGILGAGIGLLLGLGAALISERFDRRMRSSSEISEALELPVLTTIPQDDALEDAELDRDHESMQMLRTRLRYFNVDRQVKSVLVTSPSPGDGKTTVATNLGISSVHAGTRTALIETDLHRPTLSARLGFNGVPGLTELITGQARMDEAVNRIEIPMGTSDAQAPSRHLDVIASGSEAPNPAEILESREMSRILDELSDTYELVILDAPPINIVADAIPLVRRVSGVIVVGRVGSTREDAAQELAFELRELDAPVLGAAINGVSTRAYGYYGYQREAKKVKKSRKARRAEKKAEKQAKKAGKAEKEPAQA